MRVLLDTHVLLWSFGEPDRIPTPVQEILRSAVNDLVWSAVGTTELAIKVAAGKLRMPMTLDAFLEDRRAEMDLEFLDIDHRHALRIATLPRIHKDPFDRLLIAQAMVEGIPLVTHDARLKSYGVEVIW